jgi:hypothetical protein
MCCRERKGPGGKAGGGGERGIGKEGGAHLANWERSRCGRAWPLSPDPPPLPSPGMASARGTSPPTHRRPQKRFTSRSCHRLMLKITVRGCLTFDVALPGALAGFVRFALPPRVPLCWYCPRHPAVQLVVARFLTRFQMEV